MATTKIKTGIGVEITGDRINIVKLARTAQGIVLVNARSVKLPIIKKEDDKKILSESVAKAFEGLDFEKDEITLGVGGNTSFVRRVKLPPVSYSKLKQVANRGQLLPGIYLCVSVVRQSHPPGPELPGAAHP